MPVFSQAAWVLHDLGLATAVGGTLFAKTAFHPALKCVSSPIERDQIADIAWKRFSIINVLGHAAMAGSWFIGRSLLSGREVGRKSRALTIVKDVFVVGAVATGIASIVAGRILGSRVHKGIGPEEAESKALPEARSSRTLDTVTDTLGNLNLIANAGVLASTSLLAMQSSKSTAFGFISRLLP